MTYIVAFLLLGLVVLVHEFGHFTAARLVKLPIKIFSVGFGPKLYSFKFRGTEYRLSWIPIGGYVLPAVEDELEFFSYPLHQRLIMSIGGPVANFILPLFGFMLLNVFTSGFSLPNLFLKPFAQLITVFSQMLAVIPQSFTHPDQLSGIIGLVNEGGKFIGLNYLNGIYFINLISLNLGILNLLPVPALDGGKILLYLLEKIHPKFLKLHFPLAIIGWLFLLGLTIYVTVVDFGKLIG